jgi:hypothetical protein
MKYEFKVNGKITLTIEPSNNLEREMFKELFSGEVKVDRIVTSAPTGEITITKISEGTIAQ